MCYIARAFLHESLRPSPPPPTRRGVRERDTPPTTLIVDLTSAIVSIGLRMLHSPFPFFSFSLLFLLRLRLLFFSLGTHGIFAAACESTRLYAAHCAWSGLPAREIKFSVFMVYFDAFQCSRAFSRGFGRFRLKVDGISRLSRGLCFAAAFAA